VLYNNDSKHLPIGDFDGYIIFLRDHDDMAEVLSRDCKYYHEEEQAMGGHKTGDRQVTRGDIWPILGWSGIFWSDGLPDSGIRSIRLFSMMISFD